MILDFILRIKMKEREKSLYEIYIYTHTHCVNTLTRHYSWGREVLKITSWTQTLRKVNVLCTAFQFPFFLLRWGSPNKLITLECGIMLNKRRTFWFMGAPCCKAPPSRSVMLGFGLPLPPDPVPLSPGSWVLACSLRAVAWLGDLVMMANLSSWKICWMWELAHQQVLTQGFLSTLSTLLESVW